MSLKSIIESLLFVSDRPLSKKEIAKQLKKPLEDVEKAIEELIQENEKGERGVVFLTKEDKVQMATHPANSEFIKNFLDQEIKEELTTAALETLSIIAYRGPIAKEDLDEVRGVNCAIILRHLMVKGLVDESKSNQKTFYNLSFDFLKHLGIKNQRELPSYEKFHNLEIRLPELKPNEPPNSNNPLGNNAN